MDLMTNCLFCHTKLKELEGNLEDVLAIESRQTQQQRFFQILQRYLDSDGANFENQETIETTTTCETCAKTVEEFCAYFEEMEKWEAKAAWTLKTLLGNIEESGKRQVNMRTFCPEKVLQLKRDLVEKFTQKLYSLGHQVHFENDGLASTDSVIKSSQLLPGTDIEEVEMSSFPNLTIQKVTSVKATGVKRKADFDEDDEITVIAEIGKERKQSFDDEEQQYEIENYGADSLLESNVDYNIFVVENDPLLETDDSCEAFYPDASQSSSDPDPVGSTYIGKQVYETRRKTVKTSQSREEKNEVKKGSSYWIRKYQCEICEKTVVGLKNIELHRRHHTGEKPFECDICKKSFNDTSNFKRHCLRYHRLLLFSKFKQPHVEVNDFNKVLEKIIHCLPIKIDDTNPKIKGQRSNPKTACGLCGKIYAFSAVTEEHILQNHYSVLAKAMATIEEKVIFQVSPPKLLQHLKEIMKQQDIGGDCGVCGKLFETQELLNLHIKDHIGIVNVRDKQKTEKAMLNGETSAIIKLRIKCDRCKSYFGDLKELYAHKETYKEGSCKVINPFPDQVSITVVSDDEEIEMLT